MALIIYLLSMRLEFKYFFACKMRINTINYSKARTGDTLINVTLISLSFNTDYILEKSNFFLLHFPSCWKYFFSVHKTYSISYSHHFSCEFKIIFSSYYYNFLKSSQFLTFVFVEVGKKFQQEISLKLHHSTAQIQNGKQKEMLFWGNSPDLDKEKMLFLSSI